MIYYPDLELLPEIDFSTEVFSEILKRWYDDSGWSNSVFDYLVDGELPDGVSVMLGGPRR